MNKDHTYFYVGVSENSTNITVGINYLEFSFKQNNTQKNNDKHGKKDKTLLYKRNYNN